MIKEQDNAGQGSQKQENRGHLFDRDTSLTRRDRHSFTGNISPNWSIDGNPDGGYLTALIAGAMLQQAEKKSTPIITANFAGRCVPGKVDISVENISRSRQFERFQAKLTQGGRERIRALGTFSGDGDGQCEQRYEAAAPEVAPLDSCVPMPAMPNYTLFDQMDVRLDPGCAGWMQGRLTDRSEHRGWITFKQPRLFDTLSVLLATDAFPPPVFASQGMVAWVPTIELSVSLRNAPVGEWLRCRFRTRFINNGLLEEDGELWDRRGDLIAVSRQIAQFRKTG